MIRIALLIFVGLVVVAALVESPTQGLLAVLGVVALIFIGGALFG